MSSDNVVLFPKIKKDTPPQTIEEMDKKIKDYKVDYSIEFCERLVNYILNEMIRDGVDFENRSIEFVPHITMIMESLLSLHLKANNIEHPLQEMSEEMFSDDEENETVDEEN
jgi:hypothetical protein